MVEISIALGITRKVALIFITLSFVGWIIFVAGYAEIIKLAKKDSPNFEPGKEPSLYPFWVASVTGPVVCIMAVAHVLLWKQLSGIAGSITAVLLMMYITGLSYGMVFSGIAIEADITEKSIDLLFSGGFISTLSWTVVLALWPWFKTGPEQSEYYGV